MFKPLSLFLGVRYVRSRHGNGFSSFISASSTIGIGLGVMVLIILLSAMNGFERELAQRLLSIVPHAEVITVNEPIKHWPDSVKQVLKHPHVLAAAPVIKMTGMIQKGSQLKGVEVRGVDVTLETQVSSISEFIIAGNWKNLSDSNGVILGSGVANKLLVKVGDKVQILLPRKNPDTASQKGFPAPLKRTVEVVGVFKFGGTIDDTLAYMALPLAAQLMNLEEGQAQGVRMKVSDVFLAPRIAREVAYDFDYYAYIYDWTRTEGHIFNDIQLVRMVMFIVLVLVIGVASFNIVSTLIMAVNDKKGDIAILKTMGASSAMIMLTFMVQGLVNGVLGCFVGAFIGVCVALNLTEVVASIEGMLNVQMMSGNIYFIDFLPSYLQESDVYITVITALVMSLIATIYPAWRATKIEPAQVLGQL